MRLSYAFTLLVVLALLIAAPAAGQSAWHATGGPGTAEPTALYVAPDGSVYVGVYGGVHVSEDGGLTWDRLYHNTGRVPYPTALAVDEGTNLFVGIHYHDLFEGGSVPVYGELQRFRWLPSGFLRETSAHGPENTTVSDVVLGENGQVWGAIGDAVHYFDGVEPPPGPPEPWPSVSLPADSIADLHGSAEASLLAATTDGVFASTDDGASWTRLGLDGTSVTAVTRATDGTLLAGTPFGLVYRSADGGQTWQPVTCGAPVLALEPLPSGVVLAGTDGFGVVRSDDSGLSWDYLGGTEVVPALGADADGLAYAVAEGDGLRRSADDGLTWEARRWQDAQAIDLVAGANGRLFAAARDHYGVQAFDPATGVWTPLGHGDRWVTLNALEVAEEGALYLTTRERYDPGNYSLLYKSVDDGASWDLAREFDTVCEVTTGVNEVVVVPCSTELYVSHDGGQTWFGILFPATIRDTWHAGNGVLFIQDISAGANLWRSMDDGLGWEVLGSAVLGTAPSVRDLAFTADGTLLAASAPAFGNPGGLFRSADLGATWEPVPGWPADADHIYRLATRDDGTVLAGTPSGVYRSEDHGATWAFDGLEGEEVWAVAFGPDGAPYASTYWGVYSTATPVASGPGEGPDVLALQPATPNPFSRTTTLRFSLAEHAPVRLSVLDVLGREVAVLRDGAEAAGTHEVAFDARSLPSGVYFVRLVTESGSTTQQVTLLR